LTIIETRELKEKFGILQLKPCFKIVSDEIEWLRLFLQRRETHRVVWGVHWYANIKNHGKRYF